MTRTIGQILGLKPMNQFDLTASPMSEIFLDNPPKENFKPWTHVANGIPLNLGVKQTPAQPIPVSKINTASAALIENSAVKALRTGWMKKKAQVFAGKQHIPDSEDPGTVNHLNWYEATNFTVPYPGEKKVRPASDFKKAAPSTKDSDD